MDSWMNDSFRVFEFTAKIEKAVDLISTYRHHIDFWREQIDWYHKMLGWLSGRNGEPEPPPPERKHP